MRIKGKVVKGIGVSGSFLSIGWVNEQLSEKLEFSPFRGTLNLTLGDGAVQAILKEKCAGRVVSPDPGFCDAVLIKGKINGRYECGVVIPLVEGYDEKALEVVAPVRLKDALHIEDGDEVFLDLDIEAVSC